MKYGLHKMTWGDCFDPKDLDSFFADARQAGAETLEFRPPEAAMAMDRQEIRRIRSLAEKNDLGLMFCFAYPPGLDMRSKDRDVRCRAAEFLKQGIRAAKELGGIELGGVLYSSWPTDYTGDMLTVEERYERRQRSLDCIRDAAKVAEELQMPINLEVINRYEGYTINTVAEGLAFCRDVDSPYCNLLLDVFHMNLEEDDICSAIRLAGDKIGHFHVSEPTRMIPYHTSRVNWPAIGRALADAGYDKTVTIEAVISFDGPSTYDMRLWRDLIPDKTGPARIKAMREGLAYIREQFAMGQKGQV